MIRKLSESSRVELLNFLIEDKELNLFIIGDVENYGFDKDFLKYWGEYDENNKLIAVLMQYYDGFIIYAKGDYNAKEFGKIIMGEKFSMISGSKEIINKLSDYIDISDKRDTYFAKLDTVDNLDRGEALDIVSKTSIDNVEEILKLQETKIDEFTNLPSLERSKKKYEDGTGRGVHIKNDSNEIVSSAETSAENSESAMVLGVCTDPSHRGKGYASIVLSKLSKELLSEGKSLCLFYDNPEAGKIYKRLGYVDIGIWSMWKK